MNLSSSRIVIVIRSVAAIDASSAGVPATGQLTGHQSGHFYVAKSGHYYLAATSFVKAILKCPLPGYLKMSGFKVGLAACFSQV
ncbi:hypothetical protein [Burkholderia stagnalis]|uniref:hypothetical protein n=1 Tax=Burkholderia stagnalis TaxID=1503054 RepID=UPI0018C635F4|nr:hypothetical protein [Burkholderia stagnalis]